MKKFGVLIFIFISLLSLCSCGPRVITLGNKEIEPIEVIQTEADLDEVEALMYDAWKPINEMTTEKLTIPKVKVRNFEEFLEAYDFSYVDDSFVEQYIFAPMATYDDSNEMKLDDEGYIVFDPKYRGTYIPTIFDEDTEITEAYYEEKIYDDEHSDSNSYELKVTETFPSTNVMEKETHIRRSIFEKDENDRWKLKMINGVFSLLPPN